MKLQQFKPKKRGGAMKPIYIFVLAFVFSIVLACASAQDRAYEAQEQVYKQRLKLVDQYQQCVKNAGNDKQKAEACDEYLKAAAALK
jgi:hypothetical protein